MWPLALSAAEMTPVYIMICKETEEATVDEILKKFTENGLYTWHQSGKTFTGLILQKCELVCVTIFLFNLFLFFRPIYSTWPGLSCKRGMGSQTDRPK